MSLAAFRHNSEFLKSCIDKGALANLSISLVDVGCSGGIDQFWTQFGQSLRAVGFDPLVSEIERLNREAPGNISYEAAWVGNGSRPLPSTVRVESSPKSGPHTAFALSSASRGFGKTQTSITADIFNRGAELIFADRHISLDEWIAGSQFGRIDVIKCDVDGFDFEVFYGALDIISAADRPLALITEAQLHEPKDRHGTAFGDLDRMLRDKGYRLFDINIHRYSRGDLPAPFEISMFAQTLTGQALHCDAVYLLDPVMDPEILDEMLDRSDYQALLKLVLLYEVFGLPDCSVALLVRLRERNVVLPNFDIEWALNKMVPENPYGATTYDGYISSFDADPRKLFPMAAAFVATSGDQGSKGQNAIADWLPLLHIGSGCFRSEGKLVSPSAVSGHMCYGPYLCLPPGEYHALVGVQVVGSVRGSIVVEIVLNELTILTHDLSLGQSGSMTSELSFSVHESDEYSPVQIRITADAKAEYQLYRAIIQKIR